MADHPFDPTPIQALPPDEPPTPSWLPIVGVALFVVVGSWWALSGDDAATGAAAGSSAPPVKASAAPDARGAPTPEAAASAAPGVERRQPRTREQLDALRERLEKSRAKDADAQNAGARDQ
jgi:hypothetical protein